MVLYPAIGYFLYSQYTRIPTGLTPREILREFKRTKVEQLQFLRQSMLEFVESLKGPSGFKERRFASEQAYKLSLLPESIAAAKIKFVGGATLFISVRMLYPVCELICAWDLPESNPAAVELLKCMDYTTLKDVYVAEDAKAIKDVKDTEEAVAGQVS